MELTYYVANCSRDTTIYNYWAGFIIYLLLWLCATNGGPTKLYIDAAIYRLKCKDIYNTVSRSEGSDNQNLHQSK